MAVDDGMDRSQTGRPDISVCVPIYNEEDSVGPLYMAIVAALEPTGYSFEIVLVDDGSKDDTIPRLREIAASDPRVVVVRFRRNAGQTSAMQAGIDHARGRFLVTMDGDLQNDPADIPMMIDKLGDEYDIVVGWRINRQDKFLSRKLPSKLANWLIGKVTGLPIRDNGCSLKVYRRRSSAGCRSIRTCTVSSRRCRSRWGHAWPRSAYVTTHDSSESRNTGCRASSRSCWISSSSRRF